MTFGQLVDHDVQLTPVRDTESGEFMDCCAPANVHHVDCCAIGKSNFLFKISPLDGNLH